MCYTLTERWLVTRYFYNVEYDLNCHKNYLDDGYDVHVTNLLFCCKKSATAGSCHSVGGSIENKAQRKTIVALGNFGVLFFANAKCCVFCALRH